MENLIQFTDSLLSAVSEMRTPCLISELGDENSEIGDVIAQLFVAYNMLSTSPNGTEEFAEAFAAFLTRVVTMAVYTAELMHRPGVRWIDQNTEIVMPVVISPN